MAEAFRKTVEGLDGDGNYISLASLNFVSEIDAIDPRAIAFLYATELDGSPIDIVPVRWNVRRLYFAVGDMIVWFDNLSSQIERCQQQIFYRNDKT